MSKKSIQDLRGQIHADRRGDLLRLLEEFVRLESPSRDKPALDVLRNAPDEAPARRARHWSR